MSPVSGGSGDKSPSGMPNVAGFGRKWRHVTRSLAECRWFRAEVATCRPAARRTSPVSGGSGDMSPAALPNVAGFGRKWRHVARSLAERRWFGAEVATCRPAARRTSPVRGGSGDMSPSGTPNVAGFGRKWRQVARVLSMNGLSGAQVHVESHTLRAT